MTKESLTLEGEAHYVGSFPRDGHMYDYYEVLLDGSAKYVFVKTTISEQDAQGK